MAVDVGQTTINAVVIVRQFFMVDAEKVEDRGVEIGDRYLVLHHTVADVVGRTVMVAPFDPRSGEETGKGLGW